MTGPIAVLRTCLLGVSRDNFSFHLLHVTITVHVLMDGNECGVKGVELLAVFGTSMSKGFLDNGVPETIKGRNKLGQRLRPGVFKEKQIL